MVEICQIFRISSAAFSKSKILSDLFFSLFIDCLENPNEEEEIRSIFSNKNIDPVEDYLAQHQRVRILNFAVELNMEDVLGLIHEIFTIAYQIRTNENVRVSYLEM